VHHIQINKNCCHQADSILWPVWLSSRRIKIKKLEEFMDPGKPAYFDLETVALLREAVEGAWASLRPGQRETMSRGLLAERILKSAARGERDPLRLRDAALMDPAA
jgi:hypothetical protein